MTRSRAIAAAAAQQLAIMAASAIVLVTVAETFNWFLIWNEARRG